MADRLDEIRERVRGIARGPWELEATDEMDGVMQAWTVGLRDADGGIYPIATVDMVNTLEAAFIAHNRADVPWLLTEIDRLKAERDAFKRRLDAVLDLCDREQRNAVRWQDPIPVPEWVPIVQRAALGDDLPVQQAADGDAS